MTILEENIEYNKNLGKSYCRAIKTACENWLNDNGDYIQENYIKEKLDGIKQVNKRLKQLYKEKMITNK